MRAIQRNREVEYADLLAINRGETGMKAGELSELVIEKMIEDFCVTGEVVIDCGAADGRMTRIMRDAVGKSGEVIAFEPLIEQFRKLEEEFASSNVTIFNCCVSNCAEKSVTFYHVKDRRWISSLSPVGLDDYDVQEISVPVVTVDETLQGIAKQIAQRRIGFIKMDIEGAEFRAMQGACSTMSESRPIVVFENGLAIHAKNFGYEQEDFFEFFDNLGYSVFDILGNEMSDEIWSGKVARAWNFVAFDKSLYPELGEYCATQALRIAQGANKKSIVEIFRSVFRRLRAAK